MVTIKFIELLSAVGIGAIIVKLLDIFWLQRRILENERTKWKRDKKFSVYSRVARDLISQQEWGQHKRSPELHALIGEAALLIENKDLAVNLDLFYSDSLISLNKAAGLRQQAENCGDEALIENAIAFHQSEHRRLQGEAREIMGLLRQDLLR
jgi:hypothetical protein